MSLAAASTASQVEPGALGFLVVAGMGVALFFLLRSLNKQLRKITPDPRSRQNAVTRASGTANPPDAPVDNHQ